MTNNSSHRSAYEARINRAIDFIVSHRNEELTLERVAAVAAFSPYHFHRIFKGHTGETLGQFIQRTRLEWAASDLVLRAERSILEVALDSGFNGAASFARAFKERFGMSASEWRNGGALAWSQRRERDRNLGKVLSKSCKAAAGAACEINPARADSEAWQELNMNVFVRTLPEQKLAYLRHVGPFGAQGGIPKLWEELERWARRHDLLKDDTVMVGISHDNPMVTEPDKLRYDAGVPVAESFVPTGAVNLAKMAGGKYAITAFAGQAHEIEKAWHDFFAFWLPGSGYQPDDRPCLELYRARDMLDPVTQVIRCELCIPVKPL